MNEQFEIPVFFSIDNGYAPYLAAALNSAVKNSSKNRNYKAIILYQDLSEENKNKLSMLASDNFKIEFIPMKRELSSITDKMENRLRCEYFTLTIYFRLFIPAMFPQYKKGIYIDSDVVVLGDLAELYDIDIGENLIGACADKSVVNVETLASYMENAVGISRYEYINSGVLLMNLEALRNLEFDRHFLNLLNTYHFDSIAPDQDYINAICHGKIHYLDDVWDKMPESEINEGETLKLVHYNLFSKPWCYDDIRYGEYFWEYIKNTGYETAARDYRNSFTEENVKSDKECLNLLLSRGASIPNNEVTFKKIFESGVKIRL